MLPCRTKIRGQIARFGLAGTIGFIIDSGLLYIALALGLGPFAGRAMSFCCAVWVTWRINRRLTFDAARHGTQSAWREWWKYLAAMSGGGLANYAAYSASVLVLGGGALSPLAAVAVGSLAGMTVNFISAKWWVFTPS